jgi:16S rRNA (guanine966-N2)-methyltransferase
MFKGRTLRAPSGRTTRPTADRTREALFNTLAHASWSDGLHGKRVIDLFAGSGALGLEAMSRGAAFCLFVETDEAARGAIRDNIEALGLFGATRLHRRSAADLGSRPASLGAPFDVAFLDPPYGKGLAEVSLKGLVAGGWLSDSALAIVETGSDESAFEADGFGVQDTRTYGAAQITALTRRPPSAPEG